MSLRLHSLMDWMRVIIDQVLAYGLQARAKAQAARFGMDVLEAQRELTETAVAQLDAITTLRGSDDPSKKELAELLEQGLLDTVRTYQRVCASEISVRDGIEALAENPTEAGSEHSPRSLPHSNPKPLEESKAPSQPTPVRRGPGRPPGAKNRPKHPLQDNTKPNSPSGQDDAMTP